MAPQLTIFTPTYNRAYILPRLYESLCIQTNTNFRWLIIDDGSTDNTRQIVEKWIADANLEIEYYYQKNAGKMAAYNRALELIFTQFFVCVDSDDYIVKDAVDEILKAADGLMGDQKLSGIIAYKGSENEAVIGTEFPIGVQRSALKRLYETGFTGDTTLIYKSEVAKLFPFPMIPGEKFISEMYVYNQIDELYEMKLIRKVLTICNYLEDGYTKNGYNLVKNNPMGWALIYQQKKKYTNNWKLHLKYAAFAESYVFMASKEAKTAAYQQGVYKITAAEVISLPVALLLYVRRKWVHRHE